MTFRVAGGGGGGSNITLQTNGVANTSQTLLNLLNGSGITITDGGGGAITIAAAANSNTWDTIGAAAGSKTTANGVNSIVWNNAQTADSTVAWTFGETSAATGGTSTGGVPNQVLLKLTTLAASTQSPLSVYSRGSHVFSVSPTAAQLLFNPTVSQSHPQLAAVSSVNTGISFNGSGGLVFITAGSTAFQTGSGQVIVQPGTASSPGIDNANTNGHGFFFGPFVGITNQAENTRWTAGLQQGSKASADAVGYALNFRKARGTVASPTVITTGDALSTMSGYGYVGTTNTYLEASRIEHDSTGTIGDTSTGIGGIVKIMTTLAGTDSAVQEVIRFFGGSQPMAQMQPITFANLGAPANGVFVYCSDCDPAAAINSACTNAGAKTGSMAARVNGAWICYT